MSKYLINGGSRIVYIVHHLHCRFSGYLRNMEDNTSSILTIRSVFIVSVAFFLLINTSWFWEGKLGLLAFPAYTLLILVYMTLLVVLLQQLYYVAREKVYNRRRIIVTLVLLLVLGLTFLKPGGIINFDYLTGKDFIVARQEGAANCMTTLQLKRNGTFIEKNICFAATEVSGSFERKGDTIVFTSIHTGRDVNDYYSYAVIRRSEKASEDAVIVTYKDKNDTTGRAIRIIKIDD